MTTLAKIILAVFCLGIPFGLLTWLFIDEWMWDLRLTKNRYCNEDIEWRRDYDKAMEALEKWINHSSPKD